MNNTQLLSGNQWSVYMDSCLRGVIGWLSLAACFESGAPGFIAVLTDPVRQPADRIHTTLIQEAQQVTVFPDQLAANGL